MLRKRILCIVLACIFLGGSLCVGLTAYAGVSSAKDVQEVSDHFYMQIYDSQDNVVSKYKVMLTGMISDKTREITSVTFSHESGDICDTAFTIDGYIAVATLTHPVEGYHDAAFLLGADGVFSGY